MLHDRALDTVYRAVMMILYDTNVNSFRIFLFMLTNLYTLQNPIFFMISECTKSGKHVNLGITNTDNP